MQTSVVEERSPGQYLVPSFSQRQKLNWLPGTVSLSQHLDPLVREECVLLLVKCRILRSLSFFELIADNGNRRHNEHKCRMGKHHRTSFCVHDMVRKLRVSAICYAAESTTTFVRKWLMGCMDSYLQDCHSEII